jgi:hypothetical protein
MSCTKQSAVLQVEFATEEYGVVMFCATCAGYRVVFSYSDGAVWRRNFDHLSSLRLTHNADCV